MNSGEPKRYAMAYAKRPNGETRHWKNTMVTWEEITEVWPRKAKHTKESGAYLLGTLFDPKDPGAEWIRRTKPNLVNRSMIALDADNATADLPARVGVLGWKAFVHTTFTHSPEQPKYRVLVPTDRELTPEEYYYAAHYLMDELGVEQFDSSTDQPERFMFKPAAPAGHEPESWVFDGPEAPAAELLSRWDPSAPVPRKLRPRKPLRDPFDVPGVVGAFNRVYRDFGELAKAYELPYEQSGNGRWIPRGSQSASGVCEADEPGFWFSHHVNDAICVHEHGAVTAFDIARLNLFGHMDNDHTMHLPLTGKPSHREMVRLAVEDPRVSAEMAGVDFTDDSTAWRAELRPNKNGVIEDSSKHRELLWRNDSVLSSIRWDVMERQPRALTVPWADAGEDGMLLDENKMVRLGDYLERTYGYISPGEGKLWRRVKAYAEDHQYDLIREYLDNLPEWDGVERLETFLPVAEHTEYTRMISPLLLIAAVRRVKHPGCLWDHIPILIGDEGIGKTRFIRALFGSRWTGNVSDVSNPETVRRMQRHWVMLSDEASFLRKHESDVLKDFLTRDSDELRSLYVENPVTYPRRCVFWATSNDKIVLRNVKGNRRYWPIECVRVDEEKMKPKYVAQLWAEAVVREATDEQIYLDEWQEDLARQAREGHTDEDEMTGIIGSYLEQRRPVGWEKMPLAERDRWLQNVEDFGTPDDPDLVVPSHVCISQIVHECLDRNRYPYAERGRTLSARVVESLSKLGYECKTNFRFGAGYGNQKTYGRVTKQDLTVTTFMTPDLDPSDLL